MRLGACAGSSCHLSLSLRRKMEVMICCQGPHPVFFRTIEGVDAMQETRVIGLPEHARRSRFSDYDIYLLKEGNHTRLYERFGAHFDVRDGVAGCVFAVWAPNAECVAVIGDFNQWDAAAHPLQLRGDDSGIW